MGVLAIFSTGTYAVIGTMCVESETRYEKYHKKKDAKIHFSLFHKPVIPNNLNKFPTTGVRPNPST